MTKRTKEEIEKEIEKLKDELLETDYSDEKTAVLKESLYDNKDVIFYLPSHWYSSKDEIQAALEKCIKTVRKPVCYKGTTMFGSRYKDNQICWSSECGNIENIFNEEIERHLENIRNIE